MIPAYNCAAFLPAAIESVVAQTYPATEIIVVDDGSTDDTEGAVAPYLDRITYIRQANKGLPGARNTGIRASQGEYVALLDADDAWTPEKLALQMPRFEDEGTGIVYSDFSVRYADGRTQESYLVNRPLAGEGYVLDSYILSRFLFPSTMVFRRLCLEECGLFDEEMRACEDIELFARICLRWKVALVNLPLMIRYEGTNNITANSEKMSVYTILAFEKILAKEPKLPRETVKIIHEELGRQHLWRGYGLFKRGEMRQARESLKAAVRYDAGNRQSCVSLLAASYLPVSLLRMLGRI